MKVKELITYLQQMTQDLEVYAACDHGQTRESPCKPSLRYILTECEDDFDLYGCDDLVEFHENYGEESEYSSFVLL